MIFSSKFISWTAHRCAECLTESTLRALSLLGLRTPETDLFEGLEDLLPLAEVPEEQLERAGHEGGVVVHDEVEQNAQEHAAALPV